MAHHVKMDFYAEGIGWVPCDPAAAMHSADAGFGREHYDMVISHFDFFQFNGRELGLLPGIGMIRPSRAQGNWEGRTVEHKIAVEVLASDDGNVTAPSRPAPPQVRKPVTKRRRGR